MWSGVSLNSFSWLESALWAYVERALGGYALICLRDVSLFIDKWRNLVLVIVREFII